MAELELELEGCFCNICIRQIYIVYKLIQYVILYKYLTKGIAGVRGFFTNLYTSKETNILYCSPQYANNNNNNNNNN